MARAKKKATKKRAAAAKRVNNGAVVSPELETLVKEYRSFKAEHPARAARVPEAIKSKAQEIYKAGTPYSRVAEALDISPGAVKAWLGDAKAPKAKGKPGRKPGKRIEGASGSGIKQGWVKIRVEGREVEVAKADFWDLLKGGLEAGQ